MPEPRAAVRDYPDVAGDAAKRIDDAAREQGKRAQTMAEYGIVLSVIAIAVLGVSKL